MSDSPPPTSQTVAGRYQLERRIARGGMADVYLALDTILERRVALKVLDDRQVGDPTQVARFEREARSAAGLNHPNIVGIYDSGVDGGRYYIAMEYVEGSTLTERLHERGPFSVSEGCRVAADIADALDFAHRHGTIHRDVKPSNILLGADGRTRVTDFGIARALAGDEALTEVGMVMGTPRYSSPEQAQGLPLDPRSDLYSLGVVLFEMLTGSPPFTAATPVAVAQRHVSEAAPLASSLRPELAGDADRLIDTLLAKAPEARYPTATELKADLERLAQHEPLHGNGVATPPPANDQQSETQALTAAMAPAAGPAGGGDRTEAMPPWMAPDEELKRTAAPAEPTERPRFSLAFKVLMSLLAFSVLGLAAIVAWNQLDLGGAFDSIGEGDETATTAETSAPLPTPADDSADDPDEPEPGVQAVPSVTDELQADAEGILEDAGFTVRVEPVDVDPDDSAVGRVIAQRPGGGEAVPGSEVVLEVGRAAPSPTTSPTTAPPTTASPTTTVPPTEPPTSETEATDDN